MSTDKNRQTICHFLKNPQCCSIIGGSHDDGSSKRRIDPKKFS